jgi:hypothetical protein
VFTIKGLTNSAPIAMNDAGLGRLAIAKGAKVNVSDKITKSELDDARARKSAEYVERVGAENGNFLLALAPHGGAIEANTDSQADYLASQFSGKSVSWSCRGWGASAGAFDRWHVRSEDMSFASYPELQKLSGRSFKFGVSFHGWRNDYILVGGGAPYFDGVSYHGYDYYGGLEKFSNSNWGAAWNTTGPVSIVKARFIKNALAQYGATGKFLINTESAVIGFGMTKTNDDFEYTKAIYAVKAYALGMAEGLRANIWYSMKGWLLSGLVDDTMVPHQAYKTIQFLIPKLQNATFTAERASAPSVKVYEFNNQGRLILIAWSADGATRNLTLEAVPAAVYDVTGVALGRTQNQSVTSAPIIVELN